MTELLHILHDLGGLACSQEHPLGPAGILPLCARCSGMYLTAGLALLDWPIRPGVRRRIGAGTTWIALGLVLLGALHALLLDPAWHLWRYAAGSLIGAGAALLLGSRWWAAMMAALLSTAAVSSEHPAALSVAALLTPVSIMAILAAVGGHLACRDQAGLSSGGEEGQR